MLKRLLLIFTIVLSCVGCDQATKSVARTHLSEAQPVSLLAGGVRLQLAKNYGAFLSLGSSLPESWRRGLWLAGVGIVLSGLLAYMLLSESMSPYNASSWALVVGGGLSNLVDRLQHGGYVVDFINVGVAQLRTGIFNAADVCIMVGVLLIIFSRQLTSKRASNKPLQTTHETRAPER